MVAHFKDIDTTNWNQEMTNRLHEEFWKSFAKSSITMIQLEASHSHAVPMHAQLDQDAHHEIWYFTARSSRIAEGGRAMAQFMSKGHDLFACMSGTLVEEADVAVWDKHWSNELEAWFPNGRNDPAVVMLRFEIEDSEVWTVDSGPVVSFKRLAGIPIQETEAGEHEVGKL